MTYSKITRSLALAGTVALMTPTLAFAGFADFSEGVEGNLGTATVTDASTGIMAMGMYYNDTTGMWEMANLYRRDETGDEGLGVCNPLEGDTCDTGGGDINELSNQVAPEFIYLKRPDNYSWVAVYLSSLDGNGGEGEPESGQIWMDSDGDPNNGGLTLLADFVGSDANVEQMLDVVALGGANAPYLVLRPYDTVGTEGEDVNNDYLVKAAEVARIPGGEGCTPGYWKQPHHFDSWVMYSPDDTFYMAFGSDIFGSDKTLLEVLKTGGGKEYAMGRHAVAALLNALNDDVSYKYSKDEVVAAVQGASKGSYNDVKNAFEHQNEKGCPLN
ncbi:hypothetical protein [Ferrimonas balearica]|uniref:hypothetical protein n=1 Tax=Ferrimonas balearica TaxID=44012 RepID=UPI001C99D90C|nr:hypothetical protein [Ferrimonas balearica]MBY5992110.1 hypothetical protein [Ferrimonas balearica]